MRKNSLPNLALLLILLLASSSCDFSSSETNTTDPDEVAVSGTVRYMEIEGGFFAIKGDDGTAYDPVNLDPAFQVDGLRVQVFAIIRRDLAGTHMVGPVIEIKSIVCE